ncbi:Cleavage induced protein, partial [Phytophthora megakarya]
MVSSSSDDESSGHGHTGERPKVQHTGAGLKLETGDKTSAIGTSRVPQPIFSFVLAPKVSSIARDELVEWLKLRKEYEEAVKERCKDGKEDIKAVMKSIRNSFDNDLLETLCEVNWGVAKDDLTDEFLLEQIHAITDSYQNQVLPPVNELFQTELRMDMSNKDITSRVTNYFMRCNTLIKKFGFTSFFDEEKGTKKK